MRRVTNRLVVMASGSQAHTTEPTTPTEHPGTLADGTASVEIDFRH